MLSFKGLITVVAVSSLAACTAADELPDSSAPADEAPQLDSTEQSVVAGLWGCSASIWGIIGSARCTNGAGAYRVRALINSNVHAPFYRYGAWERRTAADTAYSAPISSVLAQPGSETIISVIWQASP